MLTKSSMISGPIIPAEEAIPLLGRAVFLDARAGADARTDFDREHLAGASHVDLETDLSQVGDPARGGRHPLPSFENWTRRVASWGIDPGTPVLIYDGGSGAMAAARAWWMLRALGHEPLAVIEGGWPALARLGVPTEHGARSVRPTSQSYPSALQDWPAVDANFVEAIRSDPTWRVIDARAPERYAGESEPIDPVAGHIPGARNLHWQSQLDADGALSERSALRERYAELLGGVSPDRTVCYCGSGVTACHLLLAMEASGWRGARLYVGSWSEWCRQERPRATGR